MSRIGALQLRDAVLDEGSFRSWDTPPLKVDAGEAYRRELATASAATGLDESVVTSEGTVFGRRVALVACEFDFLAGSIGVAAAERITAAVQRATAERLPLLASPSSGGTRMQEGRRVPADGQDRGGRRTAQAGAPAVPRVPASPDHRRGVRVVGLARSRHGGRTRRARRLPRPAGLRAPLRRAVPGRDPDRGEPAPARRHRRRGPARGPALDSGAHAQGGR